MNNIWNDWCKSLYDMYDSSVNGWTQDRDDVFYCVAKGIANGNV